MLCLTHSLYYDSLCWFRMPGSFFLYMCSRSLCLKSQAGFCIQDEFLQPRPFLDSGCRQVWFLLSHCAKQCTTIGKQMDACQCHGFLNYDLSTELNRRFTWLTHKTLFVDSKCHARQLLIIGAEPDSQTVSLSDTFCIQDESSVFYMSRPSADIVAVIWLDFSQSDWTHFDPSQTQATLLMQSYGCATLCFWVFGVDGSLWCQRWRGDGSVAPLWFCSW